MCILNGCGAACQQQRFTLAVCCCRLRLGTVKLLRKCLAECDVLVGRKFNVSTARALIAAKPRKP